MLSLSLSLQQNVLQAAVVEFQTEEDFVKDISEMHMEQQAKFARLVGR